MKIKHAFWIAILGISLMISGTVPSHTWTLAPVSRERAQWISANGFPLRSADPADTDYADLIPLKEKIGNARVVLLGEQTHGDGTTFLVKCRLIRFLHEVMGFNVLAWESGLYDCRETETALHRDVPLQEAILKGVFGIWGLSRQVRPIFEYARTTYGSTNPLEMAGFDCQFSASASKESFPKNALSFFQAAGPSILNEKETKLLATALDFQTVMKLPPTEKAAYKDFISRLPGLIEKNRAALERTHSRREISFYKRIFLNLENLYVQMEAYLSGKPFKATDNNVRDLAMGETLVWLADDYYRDKKIVVWAASFHNMWRGAEIVTGNPELDYKGLKTMGDTVLEKLRDNVYSITFTAYQGQAGMANSPKPEPKDIEIAQTESLEEAFHATGQKYMFLDFRGLREDPDHWLKKGITARPLGYSPMKTDWTRHFDAVIFTDIMEPSVRADNPAARPQS